jgi:hypothetical protein
MKSDLRAVGFLAVEGTPALSGERFPSREVATTMALVDS